MFFINDQTINNWLKEDNPYFDLTSYLLNLNSKMGSFLIKGRDTGIICGTEEVRELAKQLNLKTIYTLPSGSSVTKDNLIFQAEGDGIAIHSIWKVAVNIIENCSGVATRTKKLVDLAKEVNPDLEVLTTRKILPGTKELVTKGVIVGGGFPHRLGLAETILIFKQHRQLFSNEEDFLLQLKGLKRKAIEKKVFIEAETKEEAYRYSTYPVDGIQFDKLSPSELEEIIPSLKEKAPFLTFLAAGGINEKNVQDYAKTKVDGIVTSSIYNGKVLDVKAEIKLL